MRISGWIGLTSLWLAGSTFGQDMAKPADETKSGSNITIRVPDSAELRKQLQATQQEFQKAQQKLQSAQRDAQSAQQDLDQKLRQEDARIRAITSRGLSAGQYFRPALHTLRLRHAQTTETFAKAYGFDLVEADPVLRSQLSLPASEGLVVVTVTPGGLADQAGIKENDLIARLNNQAITSVAQAKDLIGKVGRGAVQVALIREGKPRELSLVGPEHGIPTPASTYWIGVPVATVDATLRSHLPTLPADSGLIATDVVAESPAAKAGVQKNDILLKVGDKSLTTNELLIEQIQKSEGNEIKIDVLRAGKSLTLSVTPQKRPASSETVITDDLLKVYNNHVYQFTRPLRMNLGEPPAKTDDIAKNPYNVDAAMTFSLAPEQIASLGNLPSLVTPGSNAKVEKEIKELSDKIEELRKVIAEMNKNQPTSKDAKNEK